MISEDELETCLKVLEVAATTPEVLSETEQLERLVARIYKQNRKARRKKSGKERARADRELLAQTGRIGAALSKEVKEDGRPRGGMLQARSRKCYICKERYRKLDGQYHLLCPSCAELNTKKRHRRFALTGRHALVTGGRIKIGYATALKFLRDGAYVHVTTRFSRDAARRYAAEPDFKEWQSRLRIHRVDFLNIKELRDFLASIGGKLPWLDILVNNAAQTVRREPGYHNEHYAMEQSSTSALPSDCASLLVDSQSDLLANSGIETVRSLLRQAVPKDSLGEPIDYRERNSWTLRLHEVEPQEVLEVLLVNGFAPYLIIKSLRALMTASPFDDRYIINVSGLDGQFTRPFKARTHPHVNMSKAALNMITRTSAQDLVLDGIYMNSVDVGWITHEGGYSSRVRTMDAGFAPPLDAVDGAARIYDPIIEGMEGQPCFGKFLKDYQETTW